MRRWIPCSERLPEKDGRYEVWQRVNAAGIMRANYVMWGDGHSGGRGWLFGAYLYDDSGITFWREEPEGPGLADLAPYPHERL